MKNIRTNTELLTVLDIFKSCLSLDTVSVNPDVSVVPSSVITSSKKSRNH